MIRGCLPSTDSDRPRVPTLTRLESWEVQPATRTAGLLSKLDVGKSWVDGDRWDQPVARDTAPRWQCIKYKC